MGKLKMGRPSVATVLALVALIVAVGGNTDAFSAKTKVIVRKGQIAKGAVTGSSIAKGAVGSSQLRKASVTAPKIAAGAVGASALSPGAVGSSAIAPDAVTAGALAPGSVYGGALGAVTVHGAPIVDLDESADLSNWTPSNTVTASCASGERVISGGVTFTNPGNRRVGIIQSGPFVNGSTQGWVGQITSDSGGTATAEVQALCLK